MKHLINFKLVACLCIAAVFICPNVFGQAENIYFDGETIGAKGTYDRDADKFVSTGGVKKDCGGVDVYFAYVLTSFLNGGMPITATYIGDQVNDYIGTDIKTIEEGKYYVVGYTSKAQLFPGVWDPSNASLSKYYNAFIAYIDVNNQTNDWIKVFGDPMKNDIAYAVSVDPDGNAWVTGITNEAVPCKQGSIQSCNQDCYSSGDLLFASFDQNGNVLINNKISLNGTTWSKGNDIFYFNNKVFVAITSSNSNCASAYNTSSVLVSYDPIMLAYTYKYIGNGSNYTASGLYNDNTGGMLMVGDIPDRGNGYLWQFDVNLNMLSFNEFDNSQNTWNFKSVLSDSFCYLNMDSLGNADSGYHRLILISGDDNTNISSLSNMFVLKIDPASLNTIGSKNGNYGKYVHNYSKNSNIIPVNVPCDAIVFQTLDYGVFGRSHDNHFSNRTSYIATINRGLISGCEEFDTFEYYSITPPEFIDNLNMVSIPILDTVLQLDMGMNWVNICEIYVRPKMPEDENKESSSNNSKADLSSDIKLMTLYPNPTSENVTISISGSFSNGYAKIIDATGKVIQVELLNNSNEIEISTANLSSGIYYISIWNNGDFIRTLKLIKQNR